MKVVFKEPKIPNCMIYEHYKSEDNSKVIMADVRHFISDDIDIRFIIFTETKDITFISIDNERITPYLFEKISSENESIGFDTLGKYINSDEFKTIISEYIDCKDINIYLPEFNFRAYK